MAKQFRRRIKKYDLEVENLQGELVEICTIIDFTPSQMDDIESILEAPGNAGGKIIAQMVYIFGQTLKFWEQFDFAVLADVLAYISEQIYTKKKG
jgi:hypothetical protein